MYSLPCSILLLLAIAEVDSRIVRQWGWVAKSKRLIHLPAHPLEKSAIIIRDTSIHRLFLRYANLGIVGSLCLHTNFVTVVVTL